MFPLTLLTTFWNGWGLLPQDKEFLIEEIRTDAGGRIAKWQTIKGSDIPELSLEIRKWQAICCLGRTALFPTPKQSSADPIVEFLQNIFKDTFLRHVIDSTDLIGRNNCPIGSYLLVPQALRLHGTNSWLRTCDTRGEPC